MDYYYTTKGINLVWEMEAGGFDFKVCLGNIAKPCLQNRNINCVYTKQNEKNPTVF